MVLKTHAQLKRWLELKFDIMKKILFAISTLFVFSLISCGQVKSSDSFTAMNTFMTVSVYSSSSKKGQTVCSQIQNRIVELENILSTTLPTSDVYFINHNKKLPDPLKPELMELLEFSEDMYQKTNGAFNPALYPVIREWGFTTEEYKVPSEERIAELLLNTDFSALCDLDDSGFTADAPIDENMELDFGAVGKGYAADEAVRILNENGISSALLDFGGNIQTLGKKPDGSLWRVGIKNPWAGGASCALSVESKAVVTSGGYERFFEDENGKRYIHIFDPTTGRPCEGELESVTIVCPSGKYADTLSTALFVMGKDSAVEWWKANSDFDFILLTKNKELFYSEGLEGFIEPLYQFESVSVIHR